MTDGTFAAFKAEQWSIEFVGEHFGYFNEAKLQLFRS